MGRIIMYPGDGSDRKNYRAGAGPTDGWEKSDAAIWVGVGAGTGTRISLVEPNNTSTAIAPGSTGKKTHAHQLNFSFGVLSFLSGVRAIR